MSQPEASSQPQITYRAFKTHLASYNGDQILTVVDKRILQMLDNQQTLDIFRSQPYYTPAHDPEILFRAEVVRHPEKHALRANL